MRVAGVIDADGHVAEPPEMWEHYLPAEYKIYAPDACATRGTGSATWSRGTSSR